MDAWTYTPRQPFSVHMVLLFTKQPKSAPLSHLCEESCSVSVHDVGDAVGGALTAMLPSATTVALPDPTIAMSWNPETSLYLSPRPKRGKKHYDGKFEKCCHCCAFALALQ